MLSDTNRWSHFYNFWTKQNIKLRKSTLHHLMQGEGYVDTFPTTACVMC